MRKRIAKSPHQWAAEEIGTIRKNWRGRVRVALGYPNTYRVGISNLGFQTVYRVLNSIEHVVCERVFLPDAQPGGRQPIKSVESGRPLPDFDLVAFSISFESDYLHLLSVLKEAGLPLRADQRGHPHPLVIAGGVACFLNPEPIAPFVDCVLIGEAEEILPPFMAAFDPRKNRLAFLREAAASLPGSYVPAFYRAYYHRNGTLAAFEATDGAPARVSRVFGRNLSDTPTASTLITPHSVFESSFLIEIGRGCPHGCRFCSAGYVYRPPRFRSLSALKDSLARGGRLTRRVGLVGAAVSDLPRLNELCSHAADMGLKLSFSSLRADGLTPQLIEAMRQSGVRTATIAPEAGSERMRRVINKGLEEDQIVDAAERLVLGGIPNLKLYFMIGLPTENTEDVAAIVTLCERIKAQYLSSSRVKRRMGQITVSVNAFVPKPFTPFQWAPMDGVAELRNKIKIIRSGLKRLANVRLHAADPRRARFQALVARGDRRVSGLIQSTIAHGHSWARTLKESTLDPDFYVTRQRDTEEMLPWDFIDHGIDKSFLRREYEKALADRVSSPCPMDECTVCGVCG